MKKEMIKMTKEEYMKFDDINEVEIEEIINDKIDNLEYVLHNEYNDALYYILKDGSIVLLNGMYYEKFENIDKMMLTFKK